MEITAEAILGGSVRHMHCLPLNTKLSEIKSLSVRSSELSERQVNRSLWQGYGEFHESKASVPSWNMRGCPRFRAPALKVKVCLVSEEDTRDGQPRRQKIGVAFSGKGRIIICYLGKQKYSAFSIFSIYIWPHYGYEKLSGEKWGWMSVLELILWKAFVWKLGFSFAHRAATIHDSKLQWIALACLHTEDSGGFVATGTENYPGQEGWCWTKSYQGARK